MTEYENVKHIAIDAEMWRCIAPECGGIVGQRRDEIEMGIDYQDILLGFSKMKTISLVLYNDVDIFGPHIIGDFGAMDSRSVQIKTE